MKKWYYSRTIWTNIVLSLVGFLTLLAGELQQGSLITVAGVLNLFLRSITNESLSQ
jgi:hypothetical protein